jgi:hypothetical protein
MDDKRYFHCQCGCCAFLIYTGPDGFNENSIPRYMCLDCNTMYKFNGAKVQIGHWISANLWADWEDVTREENI